MNIFVSYRRMDKDLVTSLIEDLKGLGHDIWFDDELKGTGGQKWWPNILSNVRRCDLFVFALTPNSLNSEPCICEYTYAHDLHKRILPIMLSSVDIEVLPLELREIQVVDYCERTSKQGIALYSSLNNLPPPQPPPDPLPPEPSVPLSSKDVTSLVADKIREETSIFAFPATSVAIDKSKIVRYGDIILLKHHATQRWLYFDDREAKVSKTSDQLLATTSRDTKPQHTYWRVKHPHEEQDEDEDGEPVHDGDIVYLEHVYRELNLHSHGHPHRSPLSQQQEVTLFGIPDTNDNWTVKTTKGDLWNNRSFVRLIHSNTNNPLHSHGQPYTGEVTCRDVGGEDYNDLWEAELVEP